MHGLTLDLNLVKKSYLTFREKIMSPKNNAWKVINYWMEDQVVARTKSECVDLMIKKDSGYIPKEAGNRSHLWKQLKLRNYSIVRTYCKDIKPFEKTDLQGWCIKKHGGDDVYKYTVRKTRVECIEEFMRSYLESEMAHAARPRYWERDIEPYVKNIRFDIPSEARKRWWKKQYYNDYRAVKLDAEFFGYILDGTYRWV